MGILIGLVLWLRPSAATFLMPGQWDPHAKDFKGRAELQGPDEVEVLWLLQVGISKRLSFFPDGVSLTPFSVSKLKAVLVGMSKKLIFAQMGWL